MHTAAMHTAASCSPGTLLLHHHLLLLPLPSLPILLLYRYR